jgi:hypothetical protein
LLDCFRPLVFCILNSRTGPFHCRRQGMSGYALFLCEADRESRPYLQGFFDSLQDAEQALALEGQ